MLYNILPLVKRSRHPRGLRQASCSSKSDACGTGCSLTSSRLGRSARSPAWSSPRNVLVRCLNVPCNRSERIVVQLGGQALRTSHASASGNTLAIALLYARHLSVLMVLGGSAEAAAAAALRITAVAALVSLPSSTGRTPAHSASHYPSRSSSSISCHRPHTIISSATQ